MKILLYSVNYAPEPTGIGKYSGEMAVWLAAQGHDVRVVCAPPYYPSWKVVEEYAWPPYRREMLDRVQILRCPLWVPHQPGGFARVLHLLTFALSSLPVMLYQILWRPEVVMTVAPALVCAPAGWLTAKICGAKSWLHIQDFEVDVAFQMGLLKGNLLKKWIMGLESLLLRRFDVISSISGRMLERLGQKGVVRERISFFPNWVDISHVFPPDSVSSYRTELGIAPETVVLLFSGSLGGKQGLLVIPQTARLLAHRKDLLFVVCGDGVMKPQIEVAAAQLPNVLMLPLQPFARLGELLGFADIHLLPQSPDAADLVLPSKLSGMLASGRPVIATCHEGTEIASVVSICGIVVPPEDAVSMAAAVEKLADDEMLRRKLGAQARHFAEENLARDAVLGKLEKQLLRH